MLILPPYSRREDEQMQSSLKFSGPRNNLKEIITCFFQKLPEKNKKSNTVFEACHDKQDIIIRCKCLYDSKARGDMCVIFIGRGNIRYFYRITIERLHSIIEGHTDDIFECYHSCVISLFLSSTAASTSLIYLSVRS